LQLWEHYSSIRNIAGPHAGPPEIKITPEAEAAAKAKSGQGPHIADWMVSSVTTSLPFLANDATIRKALYDNNANIDAAVSQLLDEPYSTPSTPGSFRSVASSQSGASSSIERDLDTDNEDEIWGPNKRQNRKLKATKRLSKSKPGTPQLTIKKEASLPDMKGMDILYI
jgi:OTU domain-containing protein 3